MTPRKFLVVSATSDGGVEMFAMKQWLRDHPTECPDGLSPDDSTSHQLRDGLRRAGWQVREEPGRVLLIRPGTAPQQMQVAAVLGDENDEQEGLEEESSDSARFALESHLRDFLARNLASIPVAGRRLRIITDGSGRSGIEYSTDVGIIDLLAVDPDGNLFVFELKVAAGSDRVVGQIARYMGWVRRHLADGKDVRGVIVAQTADEKLRYSAPELPSLVLLEYDLSFSLREVGPAVAG